MGDAQKIVDFVMANRAFIGFLAALAAYIISKIKSARKDETIDRQASALRGVASAVEDFQQQLNDREPLAVEDPKGLKKAIAYRVSRGREELDAAIADLRTAPAKGSGTRDCSTARSAAASAARFVLP